MLWPKHEININVYISSAFSRVNIQVFSTQDFLSFGVISAHLHCNKYLGITKTCLANSFHTLNRKESIFTRIEKTCRSLYPSFLNCNFWQTRTRVAWRLTSENLHMSVFSVLLSSSNES